ncbi:class II fructose-bisphosphatase [Yunchengibacter salinarum]|uniref:class II fructose-bisphosphatase n=1 Tax=Yunchengibacter salinarum TaxID=3133399 RepID=UPI0035B6177E
MATAATPATGHDQTAADLSRTLVLEGVRVTEAAAIAASGFIGKGDEKAADAAAVSAMRKALNGLDIDGTVVIGEGERDAAPMLYIGEKVGAGGPAVDIALDPLEGTTICAKAMPNALAVMAMAEKGGLLNAPDVYMDKIAVGAGLPEDVVDLDRSVTDNIHSYARVTGKDVADVAVCVLDRPRHGKLINELRALGCRVHLIGDGDIAGVIATTDPVTSIDIYMGSGGAPEGVLAAAALRCTGGRMQGRLLFRNDDERKRAAKWGITDLDRKYSKRDMASGHVIFCATGVTDGSMLKGVHKRDGRLTTETLVMRSASRTVRTIQAEHLVAESAD